MYVYMYKMSVLPWTVTARLSHRNSVRLSITRVDQAKTVQAMAVARM